MGRIFAAEQSDREGRLITVRLASRLMKLRIPSRPDCQGGGIRLFFGDSVQTDDDENTLPTPVSAPQADDQILRFDGLADGRVLLGHHTVHRRKHRRLHLHRLHGEQLVAFRDLRAD